MSAPAATPHGVRRVAKCCKCARDDLQAGNFARGMRVSLDYEEFVSFAAEYYAGCLLDGKHLVDPTILLTTTAVSSLTIWKSSTVMPRSTLMKGFSAITRIVMRFFETRDMSIGRGTRQYSLLECPSCS